MNIAFRSAPVLLLLLASAPALADETRPSALACDVRRIGARELADCLKSASERSERDLAAAVEAATKTIDAHTDLKPAQKARWKRVLNDAEAQWLTWRDAECQDVAPFEAGMGAKGADPRLACLIDENARRRADLAERYK